MSKEKEMEGDNWVDEEEECDCGGDTRVLRSAGRLAGAAVVTTSLSAILVCFPHRGISIFKLSWRFAYFIFFVGFTLRILLFLRGWTLKITSTAFVMDLGLRHVHDACRFCNGHMSPFSFLAFRF